eukprot:PhF_6_TR5154/c0_g1_i1/m.7369/K01674/cah; carbonic anhydrase
MLVTISVMLTCLLLQLVNGEQWNYDVTSDVGPKYWATNYPQCADGYQSPMNIETSPRTTGYSLFAKVWMPSTDPIDLIAFIQDKSLVIDAEAARINLISSYSVENFYMDKIRLYSPCSHNVDSTDPCALEINYIFLPVDRLASGSTTRLHVVEQITEVTSNIESHAILSAFREAAINIHTTDDSYPLKITFNPDTLIQQDVLTYSGSLMRPPCSSNAHYIILPRKVRASVATVSDIRDVVLAYFPTGNARPIQPGSGRVVQQRRVRGATMSEFGLLLSAKATSASLNVVARGNEGDTTMNTTNTEMVSAITALAVICGVMILFGILWLLVRLGVVHLSEGISGILLQREHWLNPVDGNNHFGAFQMKQKEEEEGEEAGEEGGEGQGDEEEDEDEEEK